MTIRIYPYTEGMVHAVADFNRRLTAGGVPQEFRFPETPVPVWLPRSNAAKIFQEYYLALDSDAVRGAYAFKHQEFSFHGGVRSVGFYRSPISEGTVNRAYSMTGIQLLRHALGKNPLLFALGMGSLDRPLPRMLSAMRWSLSKVPFFFRVLSPTKFLQQIQILRQTRVSRLIANVGAASGIGWLAIGAMQSLRIKPDAAYHSTCVEPVQSFSAWADEIWQQSKDLYSMIAVRDSQALNLLYPEGDQKFLRLKVTQDGKIVGWAVVLDTQMTGHPHFGCLRVGSLIDCLAFPGGALPVARAATSFLEHRGVDLIVSNQSHVSWRKALASAGFLRGPSNFIFAASPQLARLIGGSGTSGEIHLTRGDGDGPINL
jgi:hypothetical protein